MRATGDGPVDAALKAIERATGVQVVLRKFEVRSVSAGEDAQGEALVYVEYNQRTYRGSSVSTNIVESATQAFLEVINRIELAQARPARATNAPAPRASRRPWSNKFPEFRPCPYPQRSTSGSTASWCPGKRRRCTCSRTRCTTAPRCSKACAPTRRRAARPSSGCAITRSGCSIRRRSIASTFPFSEDQINHACREVIAQNGLARGAYLRPVAFRGYGEAGVVPKIDPPVEVAIAALGMGQVSRRGRRRRRRCVRVLVAARRAQHDSRDGQGRRQLSVEPAHRPRGQAARVRRRHRPRRPTAP